VSPKDHRKEVVVNSEFRSFFQFGFANYRTPGVPEEFHDMRSHVFHPDILPSGLSPRLESLKDVLERHAKFFSAIGCCTLLTIPLSYTFIPSKTLCFTFDIGIATIFLFTTRLTPSAVNDVHLTTGDAFLLRVCVDAAFSRAGSATP